MEWLVATIDKDNLLDKSLMKRAFDTIDVDQGGTISMQELREALFQDDQIDENEFTAIL